MSEDDSYEYKELPSGKVVRFKKAAASTEPAVHVVPVPPVAVAPKPSCSCRRVWAGGAFTRTERHGCPVHG